jgi:hypothetical protein
MLSVAMSLNSGMPVRQEAASCRPELPMPPARHGPEQETSPAVFASGSAHGAPSRQMSSEAISESGVSRQRVYGSTLVAAARQRHLHLLRQTAKLALSTAKGAVQVSISRRGFLSSGGSTDGILSGLRIAGRAPRAASFRTRPTLRRHALKGACSQPPAPQDRTLNSGPSCLKVVDIFRFSPNRVLFAGRT